MHLELNLIRLAVNVRGKLILTVAAGLAGGLLTILFAEKLSGLIDAVFRQSFAEIGKYFEILVVLVLGRSAIAFLSDYFAGGLAVKIKTDLRVQLYQKIQRLGPANRGLRTAGELSVIANQGVEALDAYFSQYLPQLVLAAGIPLLILIYVFPLDILTGIIFLITAPLIPFFMFLVGKAAEMVTRHQWVALHRLSAKLLDTLQGLATLKALNQSVAQIEEVRCASERYSAATLGVLRVTFLSALVLELAATLSIAVVAVEIGLRLLHGGISFQAAFFILVIAPEFYQPLRALGMRFHSGISGVTAAKPIFEFLALPENETKKIEMDESWQEGIEWEQDLEIKFERVGYTYPARGSEAVQDMSFTVKAGQKIAIVGKSGAGKSTLVNLLLRFISPQQGRITINGVNLGAIPVEEWRKRVAWVAQNPTIFHGTIAENIRLGKPEAKIDEVRIAARNTILDGFIAKLPLGYDTPVGERGARLSAGEGQRLALARAFLVDAPILILDEPTTHLDIELETELVTAIRSLCRGKTVITIAHRLSTIQEADQVLVLEKGKIIEQGTPDLLRIDGGYFSHLLESEDWG